MQIQDEIEKLLTPEKEDEKRLVSLYLDSNLINTVDRLAKYFSQISNKNFSRTSIIEEAVRLFVAEAGKVLEEKHNIDINEDQFKKEDDYDFDLVTFPAHDNEFTSIFMSEGKWYDVRLNEKKIPKIRFISLYRSKPASGISHYGIVKSIEPSPRDPKKWVIEIENTPIALPHMVKLGDADPNTVRSPRYTTLEKLKKAESVRDLFLKK